ncbi:MAG: DUF1573 domain-containing protein [Prevotella sp.]|nr:DUF1573 domain-containing protein [Prevotella sp.]MDD7045908.1 DUF1573 domain-containing protein [Prevotella sp.]MDY5546272.1 DUF1573 domain-containing protein [Prevotella sp.]
MKKILLMMTLLIGTLSLAFAQSAQKQAEIKFDKLTHNFGTITDKDPVQKCTFTFTNVGNAPLVINQAVASCGCTVPQYSKKPIMPGEKGSITVTFNSRGQFPSHFKKTVTVRSNGKIEMTRLYVEGTIAEK